MKSTFPGAQIAGKNESSFTWQGGWRRGSS